MWWWAYVVSVRVAPPVVTTLVNVTVSVPPPLVMTLVMVTVSAARCVSVVSCEERWVNTHSWAG